MWWLSASIYHRGLSTTILGSSSSAKEHERNSSLNVHCPCPAYTSEMAHPLQQGFCWLGSLPSVRKNAIHWYSNLILHDQITALAIWKQLHPVNATGPRNVPPPTYRWPPLLPSILL